MFAKRVALGLALAGAVSSGAVAFQEVQQGSPGASGNAGAAGQQVPGAAPQMGLQLPDISKSGSSSGTEVRIPGLGKLGVLPKLDFGLELLYGAADSKEAPVPNRPTQDDVTFRGSIKHKF